MGGLLTLTGKPQEGALGARCLLLLLLLLLSLPNSILCLQESQDGPGGAVLDAAGNGIAGAPSGAEEQAGAAATATAAFAAGATATPAASGQSENAELNTRSISSSNSSSNKSSSNNRNSSGKNNISGSGNSGNKSTTSNNSSSGNSSSSSDRFAQAALPLGFREPLSLLPQKSEAVFSKLAACADTDPRCQYELSVFYFLGRPPLAARSLKAAMQLLWISARGGSADAQYLLGVLHQNLYLLPKEPPLIAEVDSPLRVVVGSDYELSFFAGDREIPEPWGPLKALRAFERHLRSTGDGDGFGSKLWQKLQSHASWALGRLPWAKEDSEDPQDGSTAAAKTADWASSQGDEAPKTVAQAMELLLSAPDFAFNPPLPLVYLHAAATALHPAAASAVAWKQQFAALDGSVGQQQQACAAAANNYLPVAKATAGLYASGIPQAIEVLRLATGSSPLQGSDIQRLSTDPEQLAMLLHEAEEGNLAVHAALGRKYLFGVDGFPQNFAKARYHLLAASKSWKGESKGLLGYMYALGLGVEQDLNEAYEWFFRGATENEDPIAYNGLGLVYFFGTPLIEASPAMAFEMFNRSATLNSPDGQLNLASLYLTGTGVTKSFVEALKWLTKAVRGGSTGAAYALGTMHLSGLGAVRDCPLAVGLLKLATERAPYFAHALQRAHSAYEQNAFDEAAFNFLLLAEAGHEASQSNLAFLLDAGLTDIFFDGTLRRKRLHAQRFYEMAAAQGALSAQLRLGASFEGWLSQPKFWLEEGVKDFAEAAAFYRKVADSASWGPALAAKARYNLGAMHLFGIGVPQDLYLASHHFKRSLEADEHAPTAPVYAGLAAVYLIDLLERVGPAEVLHSLLLEPRVLFLILNLVAMAVLLILRAVLQALRRERGLTDRAFIVAAQRGPGHAAQARQQQQRQPLLQPHQQPHQQQPQQQQQQQPALPQQKQQQPQQQQNSTVQLQKLQQQQPAMQQQTQQEPQPPKGTSGPQLDAQQQEELLKQQGQSNVTESSNKGKQTEALPRLSEAPVQSSSNRGSSSTVSSGLAGAVNASLDSNRFAVNGIGETSSSDGSSSSNSSSSNSTNSSSSNNSNSNSTNSSNSNSNSSSNSSNNSSNSNSNSSNSSSSDSNNGKRQTETSNEGLSSSEPCPQAEEAARGEPNGLWLQRDWAPPPAL